jgi:predicted nucleic-acid-binding protein
MQLVDANIILRYLLEDVPQQAVEAASIIENNRIRISVEVLSEVVYVLEKVYKTSREDINLSLTDLLVNANIELLDRDVILVGLEYFSTRKLDFVDCILAGYAKVKDAKIHTFDTALKKLIENEKPKGC